LGYEGYLTANNMGDTIGCHAAIVVLSNGSKYLVDATIPVHASIHIDPRRTTRRSTAFHDYTLRPVREAVYEVERSHHPNRNAFTLIDTPVSLPDYQAVVREDYSETGRFLKSVVMVKVIDDKVWRFNSDQKPYKVESFNRTTKSETIVPSEALTPLLADLFRLPQDSVRDALSFING
jgi:hypothetical protein